MPEKQFQQLSTAHGKASRERLLGVEVSGIGGGGSKALLALVGKSGLASFGFLVGLVVGSPIKVRGLGGI